MNLAEIGLCRVGGDTRTMHDAGALMAVAIDPEPGNQLDFLRRRFAEGVRCASMNGDDLAHQAAITS